MKHPLVLMLLLPLSGCITTGEFLGSSDPCGRVNNIHAAFLAFAANTPKITKEHRRLERTGYVTVVEYCNSGDVNKPTLARLVAAYAAAVTEWKGGN